MRSIKSYIKQYRQLWNSCKNNQERHELREQFFSLRFSEEVLEKGWDSVTLGIEYVPRRYTINPSSKKRGRKPTLTQEKIEQIRREVFYELYYH